MGQRSSFGRGRDARHDRENRDRESSRRLGKRSLRSAAACCASLAIGIAAATPAAAQLHVDISVQENASDGRLSVHGFDFDTLPQNGIIADKRAFVRGAGLSGNLKLTDDPGFVSRVSSTELDPVGLVPPVGGEALLFNVLVPPASTMPALSGRVMNYWDGVLPVAWGPTPDADEGIGVVKGSLFNPTDFLLVVDQTTNLEGFSLGGASGSGSLHEHQTFLLLPDNGSPPGPGPENGVYAMLMELMYSSYSEWVPIFLGVESFTGGGLAIRTAAENDLTANFLNPLCSDGIDNDKDGAIDMADAGCSDPNDMSERGAVSECDNGMDDDGDGFVDFHDLNGDGSVDGPGDAGCLHPTNMIEAPEPGFGGGLLLGAAWLTRRMRRPRSVSGTC